MNCGSKANLYGYGMHDYSLDLSFSSNMTSSSVFIFWVVTFSTSRYCHRHSLHSYLLGNIKRCPVISLLIVPTRRSCGLLHLGQILTFNRLPFFAKTYKSSKSENWALSFTGFWFFELIGFSPILYLSDFNLVNCLVTVIFGVDWLEFVYFPEYWLWRTRICSFV